MAKTGLDPNQDLNPVRMLATVRAAVDTSADLCAMGDARGVLRPSFERFA